ncbi:hypothetical protein KIW84_074937 [Lathyrus oleraceus]|uniref:Uncharacterized protein n=1 Tax=Pisum sativum TaxID=3888 RepID=A0A9D4VV77_PEA|nr:hypothetical protein KIW84_074937 [Pisum sativum]
MNFQYRFHIRSKPRGSNGSDEENVKSLGSVALLLKGQDLPVKSDDDKEVHPVPNKQHYNRKIYPRVIRMQCFMPSNLISHLNLALLDLEDDAVSINSTEQSVSLEDYFQGRHFFTVISLRVIRESLKYHGCPSLPF